MSFYFLKRAAYALVMFAGLCLIIIDPSLMFKICIILLGVDMVLIIILNMFDALDRRRHRIKDTHG